MNARTRRSGFTLVEVLLVVVIMAILAATVIPSFTDSSVDAKESSLSFNLHTLRSQIELYKMHHVGQAPQTITDGELVQLLTTTNTTGTPGTGDDYPYGPYLVNGIPANPITGIATITETANNPPSAQSGNGGWLYHKATGNIWADHDDYLDF